MKYIHKIIKHENPYVMIDKRIFEEKRLSFKAVGILAYLLSRPPDWQPQMSHLSSVHKDKMRSLQSAMKELEACGYAQLATVVDSTFGGVIGRRWLVWEHPSMCKDTDNAVLYQSRNVSDTKQHCTIKKERTKDRRVVKKDFGSVASATRSARGSKLVFEGPSHDEFLRFVYSRDLDFEDAQGFWKTREKKQDWSLNWKQRLLKYCEKIQKDKEFQAA